MEVESLSYRWMIDFLLLTIFYLDFHLQLFLLLSEFLDAVDNILWQYIG